MTGKNSYKEVSDFFNSYILGIPYDGKIITWDDIKQVQIFSISQRNNEKSWE